MTPKGESRGKGVKKRAAKKLTVKKHTVRDLGVSDVTNIRGGGLLGTCYCAVKGGGGGGNFNTG